jgi:tetratricopeptide (TPR) repeat protein
MRARLNPKPPWARLAGSLLALGAFYWGLYRMPVPGAAGAALNSEKSRQLQDETAVLHRQGKWAQALEPTLRLHAAYPESPIYAGHLAEIYDHLGRYREEAGMWEQFLVHAPRPIEACPQIGQAYQKQGLPKQAIAAFEKCLSFEPDSPDSIFVLAHALEQDGQTDRAGALYERGLALNPRSADLAMGSARIKLRQGKLEDARQLAARTLAAFPKNPDALLVLGLACARQGDRAAARSYLERGVEIADGYADLHVALGNLAEQDANLGVAIQQYQKAAQLDKNNLEAINRLEMLRKARP